MPGGVGQLAAGQGSHVARFYDCDDELVRAVGADLGRALADGAAAVVVATRTHRDAIETRMRAAGGDPEAARDDGRYLTLDAAGTLDRFLVDGKPNPTAFERVVGVVIRRAAASGQPVHVFGEMVALLWDAGQIGAAIEVEELWNELARLVPFSLTCGYAAASILGNDHGDELATMCALHTAVAGHVPAGTGGETGPSRYVARVFALSRSAPREARLFVSSTLLQWGDSALTPDATIIAGELVANAFAHARTDFTVAVSRTADTVRIAVRDGSPLPGPAIARLAAVHGHGLGVVAAVSSRWAAEHVPGGKAVWAELARATATPR